MFNNISIVFLGAWTEEQKQKAESNQKHSWSWEVSCARSKHNYISWVLLKQETRYNRVGFIT